MPVVVVTGARQPSMSTLALEFTSGDGAVLLLDDLDGAITGATSATFTPDDSDEGRHIHARTENIAFRIALRDGDGNISGETCGTRSRNHSSWPDSVGGNRDVCVVRLEGRRAADSARRDQAAPGSLPGAASPGLRASSSAPRTGTRWSRTAS